MDRLSRIDKLIESDYIVFLNFMKAKFPVFHNSNIFFRDIQFGLIKYLEKKGQKVSSAEAQRLAVGLSRHFEEKGIFTKVNNSGWRLNYPEFTTTKPGDPL